MGEVLYTKIKIVNELDPLIIKRYFGFFLVILIPHSAIPIVIFKLSMSRKIPHCI